MAFCCLKPAVSDDSASVFTDTDPAERAVAHDTTEPEVQTEPRVESDAEGSLNEDENNAIAQNQLAKEKLQRPKIRTSSVRLYHSACNRRREMKRLDRENQALLRRLIIKKPSAGMSRAQQLDEYDRRAHYKAI